MSTRPPAEGGPPPLRCGSPEACFAHIAEHAGFLYRMKVEQQLGAALPSMDAPLPPEVERAVTQGGAPPQ